MSASAAPALTAIGFQLLAALEQYEERSAAMLDGVFDDQLYRAASSDLDRIQLYSASLPGISVAAVALLIAHAELVHTVWRGGLDRERVRAEHAAAIESLRRACMRRVVRQRV